MAGLNLRPIAAACSLLIGAAQGKDEVDRDVKQREWIWEFFLKNNSNGRLLVELMTALPFPNENLHLKRLLLLRSLSLQLSSGLFDETTLDILRALEETGGHSEFVRRGESVQPAKKRRVFGTEKNIDTQIPGPGGIKVAVKRGLPESIVGGKSSRSPRGNMVDEERPYTNQRDPSCSEDNGARKELSSPRSRGPLRELQLAVMVELTVKHLRGVSGNRKAFEAALKRYWGDVIMDTEEPVVGSVDFDGAREEVRNELWKVHDNLEFMDEITFKYTEERVRNKLATFLENAWAETQESFLEMVSSDVLNGLYEPLNPDVQRRAVRRVLEEDGVVTTRREASFEQPFVRSSRGKFSSSREKLQKTFGVFEINARRGTENEVKVASEDLMESGENRRNTEVLGICKIKDILGPPLLQPRTAEESLQTAREASHGFGENLLIPESQKVETAKAEEFDHEEIGRSQPCDQVRFSNDDANEAQDGGSADEGVSCDRAEDARNANTSPCSPNVRGTLDSSPENLQKGKGLCLEDQELSGKPRDRVKSTDEDVADLEGAAVEIVDLSSPSPQPLAQIQGSFSPPPWVASRLKTRKKLAPQAGHVEVEAGSPRAEMSGAVKNPLDTSSPDSAERLKRKNNLQAETAAVNHKFMRRNSTARTFEWEDEDDISGSPENLPGSKRVTRGATSPLIASRRASSQASSRRRKPRKWSTEETEFLKSEVFKYGKGRWKLILENNLAVFDGRTEVDLKDKWRNLERFEGLSVRD